MNAASRTPIQRTLSLDELKRARAQHLKELRLLERMTDAQFDAFRRNFSLVQAEPTITRVRAIEILRSMLDTNMLLQGAPEKSLKP